MLLCDLKEVWGIDKEVCIYCYCNNELTPFGSYHNLYIGTLEDLEELEQEEDRKMLYRSVLGIYEAHGEAWDYEIEILGY